jgi:DNA repair exonuclease SbcCD ATPase subunit
LHAIANKELVLYVLQSSLPLLNEYINNLLMKVVPFQLRMQISEDGDELELFVEDQFGLREVKSLSGGQKTVLKLCRVLATSIVFRNSFLFLDETINNVDEEVTAQLADMLLDYMRNYNLTFYTVSHSIQLQSMDIRDDIIVVPSLDMSI